MGPLLAYAFDQSLIPGQPIKGLQEGWPPALKASPGPCKLYVSYV